MHKIIRYLTRKDADLYVLEQNLEKLTLCFYPQGFAEIKQRADSYFGMDCSFPISTYGLEGLGMGYILKNKTRIKEVPPAQAVKFYDSFIQDFYLKAYPNLPWIDYVKSNQRDLDSGVYNSIKQRELTDRLVSMIRAVPDLIGIKSPCNTYVEVPLANQFSLALNTLEEFRNFIEKKEEPSLNRCSGLKKPDLIILRDSHTYIVELKFTVSGSSGKLQKASMQKQLLLAGHFLHRNWDINFTLVGVEYRNKDEKEKLRYRHFDFNPESKQLVLTKDSGW